MSNWIDIDATDLKVTCEEESFPNGSAMTIGLPPQDIPDKIRSRISDGGELVVEFDYVARPNEDRVMLQGDPVGVVVGARTGRVYEMHFKASSVKDLPYLFRRTLDSLMSANLLANLHRHYDVAAEAFSENAQALQFR